LFVEAAPGNHKLANSVRIWLGRLKCFLQLLTPGAHILPEREGGLAMLLDQRADAGDLFVSVNAKASFNLANCPPCPCAAATLPQTTSKQLMRTNEEILLMNI